MLLLTFLTMLQMPQLEVWFQRASDVVRKLSYGDMDLGIVGMDMYAELSHHDPDLVGVHDALDFGHCHLGLGVPMGGKFAGLTLIDPNMQHFLKPCKHDRHNALMLMLMLNACSCSSECCMSKSIASDSGLIHYNTWCELVTEC